MSGEKLKVDIESLTYLTGALHTMRGDLNTEEEPAAPKPGTLEAPSVTAARTLAGESLPSLSRAFQQRLDEVAGLLEKVRDKFNTV